MTVNRTDTGHLSVGDLWFTVDDVYAAAASKLVVAGSSNVAFDMPPLFFTGSPYEKAILKLGCLPCKPPVNYRIEVVPHDGKKPWRSSEPIWPRVFEINQADYEI